MNPLSILSLLSMTKNLTESYKSLVDIDIDNLEEIPEFDILQMRKDFELLESKLKEILHPDEQGGNDVGESNTEDTNS